MIEEWLRDRAVTTAKALSDAAVMTVGDGALGGYGMKDRVCRFIGLVRCAMYPRIYHEGLVRPELLASLIAGKLQEASSLLYEMCMDVMQDSCRGDNVNPVCLNLAAHAEEVTCRFMDSLPQIAEKLAADVQAAYEGDPAARSAEEILLAYPAFEAISIYRLAHQLYELEVPLLPRMMTEYAHQRTGIDIHPGAKIGRYFFIDHGTGVVVGETCVIGDHVKLYQGVTLGARSFACDENGNPVKGVQRHPRVGDDVVIYAGATILGGDTYIGDHSVIGGSVWLTHSVPAGSKIYNRV